MVKGKTVAIVLGALFGCAVVAIGLCGGLLYMGFRSADKAVSPSIDGMFAAIEARAFADTYETHTTEELRDAVSKEDYAALGNAIGLRLGELKSKSLRGFKMRQFNAGSYVDVTYAAEFEKGSGTIAARLKKEGDAWKFVAFHVNSPVFNQDLATVECSVCGEPHSADARFCPSCGAEVEAATETAAGPTDEPATEPSHALDPATEPDSDGTSSPPDQ